MGSPLLLPPLLYPYPLPHVNSDSAYRSEESSTWLLDLHLHRCVTLRRPFNLSDLIMSEIGITAHLTGLLRRVTETMNKNKQWAGVGCSCGAGESSLIPDSSPSATQTPAIWSPLDTALDMASFASRLQNPKTASFQPSRPPCSVWHCGLLLPEKLFSLSFWPTILPWFSSDFAGHFCPVSSTQPSSFWATIPGPALRGVLCVLFLVCSQQSVHRENTILAHKSSESDNSLLTLPGDRQGQSAMLSTSRY